MSAIIGATKSITKLTPEQTEFYQMLRIRASSKRYGQPYIAHAIFRLIPINAPGLGTMGVDEFYRVYIDFDFMMSKGVEFATEVLNHEPWHILRKHAERAKMLPEADSYLWNVAGDAELNDDIQKIVPKESVFPSSFGAKDGETAEHYYAILKKKQEKEEKDKQKNQQGQPQEDKGDKGGQDQGNQPGQDKGEQPGGNQPGGQQPGQGGNQPGQGQGNQPGDGKNGERGNPDGGKGERGDTIPDNPVCASGADNFGDYKLGVEQAESVSEFDQDMIAQDVAQQIKDQEGRDPGSVPAGHKLWADEKLAKTPTPWQKILRGAIKNAITWQRGKLEYVRSVPNRRQPVKGVLLPALKAPKAKVLIGVDTSGSHIPMLPRVLNEVNTIMKKTGIQGKELRVFSIDTQMKDKPQFVSDPRKIDLKGGGGTAMRPAFEFSAKDRKNHDIFILFTDGELPQGDYPKHQPASGVRYVICILGPKGSSYLDASFQRAEKEAGSWARVVKIEVPDEDR